MSPRTKVSRQDWLSAAGSLLDEGRIPTPGALYGPDHLGVTKGSFYSHSRFPGGMDQFRDEVVAQWEQTRDTARLSRDVQAIRSPRERLRLIRSRFIETAQSDGAVRRWAARIDEGESGAGAARDAVARVDAAITALVAAAMHDLGFDEDNAAIAAGTLVNALIGAYHSSPVLPPADSGEFEGLLTIFTNAASLPGWAAGHDEAAAAPGARPDEIVVYPVQGDLTAAERDVRQTGAQRFADDDAAAHPDASGRAAQPGRPAAGAEPRS